MDLAGKQIGNYVAKSELGSGGMGVVYLCEHPLIRRRVAAKVLHEELAASEEIVRRLFAEAKAANDIHSEHIIEVLDFGRLEDNGLELVYLIMELLEGEALGNRLWRTGLTIEDSLHIVRQCCTALEASHKAGIIHRDLKPENIFLLERRGDPNFVKILDFGIAKVSGSPSTKTRTGVLLGTPAYMSPEQCRGSGTVDARADVYSLGIVLYELTTGDVPFNAEGYGQILLSQMMEKPRPPSTLNKDLPKAVEAIILRALDKDPANRFQSMEEFGRAISETQTSLQMRAPIAQIPRKGLHQRETLVRNGRKRGGVEGALAQIVPTPIDAAMPQRMAETAADAPTQMMDAIVPPSIEIGLAATESHSVDAKATIVDREAPQHVSAGSRSEPATKMSRDGVGNLTTGPQGMVLPREVVASPPAKPGGIPTVLSSQAPTLIRSRVAPSLPEDHRPTSHLNAEETAAIFPRTGRNVLVGLAVLAILGVVLALIFR